MNARRWLQVGLVLVITSGCAARADWIGRTLVTVDVTGRWVGTWDTPTQAGACTMTLQQIGPKATGDISVTGQVSGSFSGPIEGTVRGDVLTFTRPEGQLRGEVSVAGTRCSEP
jgi:hypothetical protein